MKKLSQNRPIQEPMPVTLRQLVMTVQDLSRNAVEAAHVINHMLLTQRVRFIEPLDQEEIRLLHS